MNKLERKTLTIHFDEVYQLEFSGYKKVFDYYHEQERHTHMEHKRNGNRASVDSNTHSGTIAVTINGKEKKRVCIGA